MKKNLIASAVLVLAAFTLIPAQAADIDVEAAKKLAKRNDCFKCHAIDKTKKGPSYMKIAAKYRGKADAESSLIKQMTTSPRVKLEDGTEEDHKNIDTRDQKELTNLANWILSL